MRLATCNIVNVNANKLNVLSVGLDEDKNVHSLFMVSTRIIGTNTTSNN